MSCPLNPFDCPGEIGRKVAGDAFESIARKFGQLADSAINWLWQQISAASAVRLDGAGFATDLKILMAITAVVAVGLFALQITASALRRDVGGLGRALKGLVIAFIGGGAAIAATNALLAATDSLSEGVVKAATGGSIEEMGRALLGASAIESATANPSGILLLALFAMVATVAVWAALVVRKVLIVVSAVFAPVAFAGSIADVTVSWTRRWIETTIALVVSKLVLVIIFVVGLGVLVRGAGQSGGGATQSMTQVVSGLLVLLVAGTAPLLALKLVHWSGNQFHHLHALASTSTGGVHRAVDWSRSAASRASMATAGVAVGGGFKMIGSAWPQPGRGRDSAPGNAAAPPRRDGPDDPPPTPPPPPSPPLPPAPPAPPRTAGPSADQVALPLPDPGPERQPPERRRP